MQWNTLANDESIKKTADALKENGIDTIVVKDGEEAKKKILEMIPKNSEVMTMTSITLETTGIANALNETGDYDSIKTKLSKLDRNKDAREMQQIGSAPEWAVGSAHAITENGTLVIASMTGSQLPAYAYGAAHVIWVVGTQKIVKNFDDANTRIYDYVLPLETKRARKAYGLPDTFNSNVSKLLIINKEVAPNRLTVIFVKEELGF
jgi:L-lactate utilization protein LutC